VSQPSDRSPKHAAQLDALVRIEGQIRGIQGMIRDERYCVDLLTQLRAVQAALRKVERGVLDAHLQSCVDRAFASGDPAQRDAKIREILSLFDWEAATRR
jgi:DNA-binding FrmR family transcriptional regulator